MSQLTGAAGTRMKVFCDLGYREDHKTSRFVTDSLSHAENQRKKGNNKFV